MSPAEADRIRVSDGYYMPENPDEQFFEKRATDFWDKSGRWSSDFKASMQTTMLTAFTQYMPSASPTSSAPGAKKDQQWADFMCLMRHYNAAAITASDLKFDTGRGVLGSVKSEHLRMAKVRLWAVAPENIPAEKIDAVNQTLAQLMVTSLDQMAAYSKSLTAMFLRNTPGG